MVKEAMQKVREGVWKIPKSFDSEMNVDGVVYANSNILGALEEGALQQLVNITKLPGAIGAASMPDIHWGYGMPVGGMLATDPEQNGIISAGCAGFDINCGVRLLRTDLTVKDIETKKQELLDTFYKKVPSGVGKDGLVKLTDEKMREAMKLGAEWAVENGYGEKKDLKKIEEYGKMKDAEPSKISDKAFSRGRGQLGTLGSGNHFLEIQRVDQIFDEKTAKQFGITEPDQITIMIHTGSRGFGYEVASQYLEVHERAAKKYGIKLPDRQLVCAPFNSEEGQDYWKAANCAVNFTFCNREIISEFIYQTLEQVLGQDRKSMGCDLVYDLCHNVAKYEEHKVDGKKKKIVVHRKGATRAFPAGHPEVPEIYRDVGQPVLIPGSFGTASYALVGTQTALDETFGTTAHGAGRVMSRTAALKKYRGDQVKQDMAREGKLIKAAEKQTIAEEAPGVYKDVDEVIRAVELAGISKKIVRMTPLASLKG